MQEYIDSPDRPTQRVSGVPAKEIVRHAVEALHSKKALNVVVVDVRDRSGVTDFLVIGTGQSDLQVRAIIEAVLEQVKEKTGERPWQKEGMDTLHWSILDFVDVVVHIFDPERRAFYDLERLWADAPMEEVAEDATEIAILNDSSHA